MKQSFAILSLVLLSNLPSAAALSGRVTDLSGNGIPGVGVTLARAGTTTTTDATGVWILEGSVVGVSPRLPGLGGSVWTGKSVELTLVEPSTVSVEAFDLKGAQQGRLATMKLGAGSHSFPLALSGSGVVWLRVTVNGRSETMMVGMGRAAIGIRTIRSSTPLTIGVSSIESDAPSSMAARSQVVVDTLWFSWKSKVVARIPLSKLDTAGIPVRLDTASGIGWNDSITYGSLYDARDGQVYRTVKIGSQTWIAQDLNYKPSGADSGWCNGNLASNCNTYGRLYTWTAVMASAASSTKSPSGVTGICPAGWHVPSDPEWTTLVKTVEANPQVGPGNGGPALKAKILWKTSGLTNTDIYGFRALPGGYFDGKSFSSVGFSSNWWDATMYDDPHAYFRFTEYLNAPVNRGSNVSSNGYSLRCTQD